MTAQQSDNNHGIGILPAESFHLIVRDVAVAHNSFHFELNPHTLAVGVDLLGKWEKWNLACDPRQDGRSSPSSAHDAPGTAGTRGALEGVWVSRGGLGMENTAAGIAKQKGAGSMTTARKSQP
jgi:hypothetical protein